MYELCKISIFILMCSILGVYGDSVQVQVQDFMETKIPAGNNDMRNSADGMAKDTTEGVPPEVAKKNLTDLSSSGSTDSPANNALKPGSNTSRKKPLLPAVTLQDILSMTQLNSTLRQSLISRLDETHILPHILEPQQMGGPGSKGLYEEQGKIIRSQPPHRRRRPPVPSRMEQLLQRRSGFLGKSPLLQPPHPANIIRHIMGHPLLKNIMHPLRGAHFHHPAPAGGQKEQSSLSSNLPSSPPRQKFTLSLEKRAGPLRNGHHPIRMAPKVVTGDQIRV